MDSINTANTTPEQIAKALHDAGLLDKVKAVEEQIVSHKSIKYEGKNFVKIWLELIHDLDGNLIQKRRYEYSPYRGAPEGYTIISKTYNKDWNVTAKEILPGGKAHELNFRVGTYFEQVSTEVGQVSPPEGVSIVLDLWAGGVDTIVTTLDKDGKPTGDAAFALGSGGSDILTASLDLAGRYVLSGLPDGDVALIYVGEVRVD